MQGFNPADVPTAYGDTLTFWDWQQRRVTQTVKLGPDGLIPLELRFLHDPAQPHGYVGAALSSNVIHFTKASRPAGMCRAVLLDPFCSAGLWKETVLQSRELTLEASCLPELRSCTTPRSRTATSAPRCPPTSFTSPRRAALCGRAMLMRVHATAKRILPTGSCLSDCTSGKEQPCRPYTGPRSSFPTKLWFLHNSGTKQKAQKRQQHAVTSAS